MPYMKMQENTDKIIGHVTYTRICLAGLLGKEF